MDTGLLSTSYTRIIIGSINNSAQCCVAAVVAYIKLSHSQPLPFQLRNSIAHFNRKSNATLNALIAN